MVDMTSRRVAPLLRSLAGSTGVAYVSMVDSSYYRDTWGDEELTWWVQPTSVQMLQVVADIVRLESLNNVALVYDHTFGQCLSKPFATLALHASLNSPTLPALVYDHTFGQCLSTPFATLALHASLNSPTLPAA